MTRLQHEHPVKWATKVLLQSCLIIMITVAHEFLAGDVVVPSLLVLEVLPGYNTTELLGGGSNNNFAV